MRRIVSCSEVCLVAAITRGWECRVVVIRMALRTLHREMRPGEREGRGVVVETGGLPPAGCVAQRAVSGEPCRNVVGTGRGGEVSFVTCIARCWRGRVVVVGVALRTAQCGVHASERIVSVKRMVELRI